MTTSLDERGPKTPAGSLRDSITGWLGHPAAYLVTTAVLLALFSWPFLTDAGRVAPTKDPAFYTWRTEVLITEEPLRLLSIEGPKGMFAAGYRVAAPVIGALLRQVATVSSLNVTLLLMVLLPVLVSLLLAGFAARHLKDPIVWHSVAVASAGLLLTPPFVGYLDNVLCLFFLAASLFFLGPSKESWGARIALFIFMLLAGLTHPTTLAIFCATLGLMAGVRLLTTKFDVRSVLKQDGWMLGTGIASVVVTVAIWSVGIWGRSLSLSEAALPPPYASSFFIDRMMLWIDTMRPALNGPLFVIGIVGLLAAGRRALDEDVTRVSILWLAPLAGLFGFIAGLTYPYYRFFNTTLAWVLLIGIGAGIAIRFFIDRASSGGVQRLALLGVLAIVVVLATNLTSGFAVSGWTKAKSQWLEPQARLDLDELRNVLAADNEDRPVVFVIDDEPPEPFQIYGFSKLSGNTSRYGLPPGQIDQGYLYLGSLENLVAGEPTSTGDETYDQLSIDLLEDTHGGIEGSEAAPVIVLAEIFNPAGANVETASGDSELTTEILGQMEDPDTTLLTVHDGAVFRWLPGGDEGPSSTHVTNVPATTPSSALHIPVVLWGLILMLLPGYLALNYFLPDAGLAEGLGLVPAISLAMTSLVGITLIAVLRQPFGPAMAWITLAITIGISVALRSLGRPRAA
ncbi:MAG TPA: hypothetical protein VE174_08725 [Actinomycetota bacterium]|nr:hypothetical protein [Actinomycetota bacterium]